ncbi:hypothetical protein L9F63_001068, partial [Diploptera punctata]
FLSNHLKGGMEMNDLSSGMMRPRLADWGTAAAGYVSGWRTGGGRWISSSVLPFVSAAGSIYGLVDNSVSRIPPGGRLLCISTQLNPKVKKSRTRSGSKSRAGRLGHLSS